MFWTKDDLIQHNCTPDQYHGQFLTPRIIDSVGGMIGRDWIISAKSLDDIPFIRWYATSIYLKPMVEYQVKNRGDIFTISLGIAVAKMAANNIKNC